MSENEYSDDDYRSQFPSSFGTKKKISASKPTTAGLSLTQQLLQSTFKKTDEKSKLQAKPIEQKETDVDEKDEDEGKEVQIFNKSQTSDDEAENSDSTEWSETSETPQLPTSNSVNLSPHNKLITSLSLDRSGTRLITGSYDTNLHMYDFNSMDPSFQPFRQLTPLEGYHVNDLSFSNSGDSFLVVTDSTQVKVFDREGKETLMFNKGDPYLRDMRHTAGHVAAVTTAQWHPTIKEEVLTASLDGTVRIWDINSRLKPKATVVVNSNLKGGRSPVNSAVYSKDSKYFATASVDGSIKLWNSNGPFTKPAQKNESAHSNNTHNRLKFLDEYHLVSRGGDHTVKLFDTRQLSKPVLVANDLLNNHSETDISISPDNKFIVTGTGHDPTSGALGQLVVLDKSSLQPIQNLDVGKANVVKVLWHPNINQILCGSSNGAIDVFYDPQLSTKGVLTGLGRKLRHKVTAVTSAQLPIYNPLLPNPQSSSRIKAKLRKDPIASKRPDLPTTGLKSGKVGIDYSSYLMQSLHKDTTRDDDPREALLKYAKLAKTEPKFVDQAYHKNQPKPVYDERDLEEDYLEVKRKA